MTENQHTNNNSDQEAHKELNGLIVDYLDDPVVEDSNTTIMSTQIGDIAGALAKAQSEMTMV